MITALLAGLLATTAPTPPPEGWRYPTQRDVVGDWKKFEDAYPTPFHVRGDFNGDGLIDDAWILVADKRPSWGVFVFLSRKKGGPKIIELDGGAEMPAQRFGLRALKPGVYDTGCGRGYWKCRPGEPAELRLKRPGLGFFLFEGAESLFWWDDGRKAFVRTWMTG